MSDIKLKRLLENETGFHLLDVVFFEKEIPHELILQYISVVDEPNKKAHGSRAKVPIPILGKKSAAVPGIYIDNIIQEIATQYIADTISRQTGFDYFLNDYSVRSVDIVPVDSKIMCKLFFFESGEGIVYVIPELMVKEKSAKNFLSNDITNLAKTSKFIYRKTSSSETPPSFKKSRYYKTIKKENVDLFYKSLGIKRDTGILAPTSYLVALTSNAIGKEARKNGSFHGRTPIYTSRTVTIFEPREEIVELGDKVRQYVGLRVTKDNAMPKVLISDAETGSPIIYSTSNIKLLK